MKTVEELHAEVKSLKKELNQQKAQQISESEIPLLLEHLHAGVIVHAADTSILYANQAASDLLGLTIDQLLGKAAPDPQWYFTNEHGIKLELDNYPVNIIRTSGKPLKNYVLGVKRSQQNSDVWLLVNGIGVLDETSGEIAKFIITFIDITEQHFLQNEKRMTTVINMTPVGVCITNKDGIYEHVNPAYCKIYKYDASELLGNHFTKVVHEDNKQVLSDLHDRFIGGAEEVRGEWDVVDKQGNIVSILAEAAIIIGNDGEPKKVTFVIDITEQKELENLKNDIEKLMRHDLKTPLNAISVFPQVLLESDLSDQQKEMVVMIKEAGNSMLKIIDSYLIMTKMEEGTYELNLMPVDLIKVLNRTLTDLKVMAEARQIEFELMLDRKIIRKNETLFAVGEETLCYSVFSNLIKNAVEASPENEKIQIDLTSLSEQVKIVISNRGAVPKEIRNRFFEKYITAGKNTGTGLGTYSAKLMIETQHGEIELSSVEEDNTKVLVKLPRYNYAGR